MDKALINKLIEEAKEIANRNFCCGHSGFTVGAALLTSEGKVYKGFNVERFIFICYYFVGNSFIPNAVGYVKPFAAMFYKGAFIGFFAVIVIIPNTVFFY